MRKVRQWTPAALLAVGMVVSSFAAANAQTLADVHPGSRVRLVLRDSLRQEPIFPARQVVIGQFVRATSDSLWLRAYGASEFSVAP